MAEERLIDTDKDKKYRIKINADGEEELEIDESGENAEEATEEVVFDVEEPQVDEGELTPKELEERREAEEKELAERRQSAEELVEKARAESLLFRYATALEYLEKAEELDSQNGEIYALRLSAYTRDFTDYTKIVTAAESADKVKELTSPETKKKLMAKGESSLKDNIESLRKSVTKLSDENEAKKAERAVKFKADRNKSLIAFCILLCAFAVSVGITVYFAGIIYTVSTGLYLILTGVFGGLSLVTLIALAFAARWLNITCRRIRLNKRNTTTKLGREMLARQAELKASLAVYDAIGE